MLRILRANSYSMNMLPFSKTFSFAILLLLLPLLSLAQKWRVVEVEMFGKDTTKSYAYVKTARILYDYNSIDRGSNYTNDTVEYEKAEYYYYDKDSLALALTYISEKTYGQSNRLLYNITRKRQGGSWMINEMDSIFYTNGLMTDRRVYFRMVQNKISLSRAYAYAYNAQNLISQMHHIQYSSNGSVYLNRIESNYYSYDNNKRLIVDSMAQMNMVKNEYIDGSLITYNYHPDGRSKKWVLYDKDSVHARVLDREKSYYYNSKGQLIFDSLIYDNAHYVNYQEHRYTYNAQGRLIADTAKSDQLYVLTKVTTYKYNPWGLIEEVEVGDKVAKDSIFFYDKKRYRYELYQEVGIKETYANNNDLTLYPNPATYVLYIKTNEAWQRGYIYSSLGQVVQEFAHTKQVSINNLPAGNYFIQLVSDGGAQQKAFSIIK